MTIAGVSATNQAGRQRQPYSSRMGIRTTAWYESRTANAIGKQDATSHGMDRLSTARTNIAIAASQNATNGTSVSSELPLTTNTGVTRNSIVARRGCSVNRRARASAAAAAINENTI